MLDQVDRIEAMRAAVTGTVGDLPVAVRSARPPDGGWTLLEIVEHLVLAEESVLANLDQPDRLRARRTSLRSRMGFQALVAVLLAPFPVGVPSSAMKPRGDRSFDELCEAWESSHRALRRHVMAVEEGRISGAVFVHPVSGPLTTRQAVRLLRVHLRRHQKQMRRVLTALGL